MSAASIARRDRVAASSAIPTPEAVPPRTEASQARFCAINGRFLTQAMTGVQRCAHEVIGALDPLLAGFELTADLLSPPGAGAVVPTLQAIVPRPFGWSSGHVWEQAALPLAGGPPLLNLCNTAPVLRHRQVVCLHDANVFTAPESYRQAFRLFYRALHPLLARRAAILTTVSQAAARDLSHHLGIERRRITVLPNGHEHALRWQAETGALRRLPGTRPFVLLLGSRARHKNLELLLRLAPALDDRGLDLVVTGGRAGVFAVDGKSAVNAGNLHWLGSVSDNDLAGLLGRALCLAFPSWTEGFGLPILESMTRGCPVIASDRASMPEVCGSAALLAAPDDPAAWLAAIDRLQASAALRADLIGRGAEQARRFSWTDAAAGYIDLLERLQ